MGILRSVLILLVGAALATFLWSNYDQRVVIKFTDYRNLHPSADISLSAALVGAMLAGFLLAVALSLPNQFRLRGRVRESRRRIDRLENEIAELRKLPLSDVSETTPESPGDSGTAGSKSR